jgi:hypothetical protein
MIWMKTESGYLVGGNFYALKPQVGRHNASKGVFLKGMATGLLHLFLQRNVE